MQMLGDLVGPLQREMEEAQALTSSPTASQLLDFFASDNPHRFSEAVGVSIFNNSTITATAVAAATSSSVPSFSIDPTVVTSATATANNLVPSCPYDFSVDSTIIATAVAATNPSSSTCSYGFSTSCTIIAPTIAAAATATIPSCSYYFSTDSTAIATTIAAPDPTIASSPYNFSSDKINIATTIAAINCSVPSCYDFSMDPATLASLLDYEPPNTEPNELIQAGYPEPTLDDRLHSVGTTMRPAYEKECLMQPGLSSCSFMDPRMTYDQAGSSVGGHGQRGYFPVLVRDLESGLGLQEAIHYGMAPSQNIYGTTSRELQVFGDGQQQQQPDDSTGKVGRLSAEERKEKIHRYMKKRNERNFSKKIKYACRKTLADSRPRVRGRFAKNEESVESVRPSTSHNEYDDDDEMMMKEEDTYDSSDILARLSGLNSSKYNYMLESWI